MMVTGKSNEVKAMVRKYHQEHIRLSVALSFLGQERTDVLQRWVSVAELRRLAFASDATVSIGDR